MNSQGYSSWSGVAEGVSGWEQENEALNTWSHSLSWDYTSSTGDREDKPQVLFWDLFFILTWFISFSWTDQCWIYVKPRGIPQLSIRRNASFPRETNSSDITQYFDARYVSLEDAFFISRQSQFLLQLTLWLIWLLLFDLCLFLTLIAKLNTLSEKNHLLRTDVSKQSAHLF